MSEESLGTRVGFEVGSERGCVVLRLSDGAVLHVHPIIVDVIRTSTPEGQEPAYLVAGALAVRLMEQPGGVK